MWLEQATEPFKLIPRYLVPSYFDVIIVNVYSTLIEQCFVLMSRYIHCTEKTFVDLKKEHKSIETIVKF